MYNAQTNPYQKYKEQSVMTMTQGEMLVKLYDGVVKHLTAATILIEQKDFDGANQSLQKAQQIITYLRQTLNHSYEVSKGLDQLYEYFIHEIVQANMKKDAGNLSEVISMVGELKESFLLADRSTRSQ